MTPFSKSQHSRRNFIKDFGITGGVLILLGTGCDIQTILETINNRPTRRKLPNGQTPSSDPVFIDLQTYSDAVAQMKALPASDPRSWAAQSLIHGSNASGAFTFCQHNTNFFLPWHRAYLWQFEEICRDLTGNQDFALPYWNWAIDKHIANAFTAPLPNPLFSPRTRTNVLGAANNFTYQTLNTIFQSAYIAFSNSLEGQPHNNGHVQIGQDMVSFQSPLDPLFWTHHCMVDYCWFEWNITENNDNPNTNSG